MRSSRHDELKWVLRRRTELQDCKVSRALACETWKASIFQCKSPCTGPLAHREEQGTFNPKVPGSRPGRPTKSLITALEDVSLG